MGRKVRYAVVGCGLISKFHIAAISAVPDAELAGVYDSVPALAISAAERYKTRRYESLGDIWRDVSVDAVCVCTPSGAHGAIAIEAAEHGKHVLVEKPMAITSEECEKLVELSRERDLRIGVVSQLRFSPQVAALKKAIDAGALGKLRHVGLYMRYFRTQEYYDSAAWRGTWSMDGGGALMNQGIHGVDLLRYLAGPAASVFARMGTMAHDIEVEDCLMAVIELENGAMGTIEATTCDAPGFPRRLELYGERGHVILEEDVIAEWSVEGAERPADEASGEYRGGSSPGDIGDAGHIRQIADFTGAVLGSGPLLVDAVEGAGTVGLILGAYRSARTGAPVKLR